MAESLRQQFFDFVAYVTGTKNFFPDLVFDHLADKRVENWLFMKTPHTAIGIGVFYLLAIYVLLPKYMEKRKPYELKTFIKFYNLFQVVSCSWLIYGIITSGWTTTFTLACHPIIFTEDKLGYRLAGFFWWNMMLKVIELIETMVFALRKKNNQISLLHVYHHVSTFGLGWCSCKYGTSAMLSVTIILNSSVHILMYTYYFLSSLGPEWQKKLVFVKPKLTIIQLTQLIILFIHTLQALSPNCKMHKAYPAIYLPALAGNIILFLRFYHTTYVNKKNQ